jgi:hypothetical protein
MPAGQWDKMNALLVFLLCISPIEFEAEYANHHADWLNEKLHFLAREEKI